MPNKQNSLSGHGKHAYEGLDRALHEKARLGIMTSLLTHPDGLRFNELKDLCSLTDGNLSRHLQVLSQAGLVEIWKGYDHNRPQTLCRLSSAGRERFLAYLEELERILKDAAYQSLKQQQQKRAPSRPEPGLPRGWAPA